MVEENIDAPQMSAVRAVYSTVLKPTNASVEETVAALSDIENYGAFKTQALRNASTDKSKINKAIEQHFGPSIPSKKKAAEKLRGEPFPIRTKQSLDDFMKQFTSKPKLLSWVKSGDSIVFPQDKNPVKAQIKKILDTVLSTAGIEYTLSEKEEI